MRTAASRKPGNGLRNRHEAQHILLPLPVTNSLMHRLDDRLVKAAI
jgi:hypothetical protein